MKKFLFNSIGLVMTVMLLGGIYTSSQQNEVNSVIQTDYDHGQPWG